MPTRSRSEVKRYKKHQDAVIAPVKCIFCDINSTHDHFIRETKSFKVIKNIFPYSTWDGQSVDEHILLLPKKHTDTLSDLTRDEAVEFVDILGSYEAQGYNVWARAPQSTIKTIVHQHTHLIKPGKKTHRFMLYIKKPYFFLHR